MVYAVFFCYIYVLKIFQAMYKHLIKPFLFCFNPETAHNLLFSLLSFLRHIPFARAIIRLLYKKEAPGLAKEVFGITFPNPVGLAGGLDKNGEFYNDMANFGFGFVELIAFCERNNKRNTCFLKEVEHYHIVCRRSMAHIDKLNNKGNISS